MVMKRGVVKVIDIRLESLQYYTLRFERTKTYGQLAFQLLHGISSPAVGPMRTVSMTWFWRLCEICCEMSENQVVVRGKSR